MIKIFNTLLLVALFISCTKNTKKNSNELNLALTGNVSTLDPALSYDTVSAKIVYQVYESLYEYEYLVRPYQLKPLLAESFPSIENNGLKYTIKLKDNIYYHNSAAFKGKSRKVIAQDFINQFKRLAYKPVASNGWWLFDRKIKGLNEFREKVGTDLNSFFETKVSGLYAPDDLTLVIELTKPYPQLIYALAMSFTTPIPKEIIVDRNNDLQDNPVGTGPYIFKSWERQAAIKLERNRKYHKSVYPSKGDRFANEKKMLSDSGKNLPFIDKINFSIMKEAQTRWLNFRAKKIDAIVLTKDHFPLALNKSGELNDEFKKEGIQLQIAPTLTFWWLSFNMNDEILGKNLKLRQAIAHAINIENYIALFTNNIGLKANSIYPPGVLGYSPTHKPPYEYDLNKAKMLMKEAGHLDGKGLPVFKYDVRGSSTTSRQMGEFIAKELAKIGIKIEVVMNTFPGFLKKAKKEQLQIWQGGWAMDYPDPENVAQLLISKNKPPGPNSSSYHNPVVDKLYEKLFTANSEDQILELTQSIEKQVEADLPWIMQFYSRNYVLFHSHVKNFRQSDLVNNNIKYLRVE